MIIADIMLILIDIFNLAEQLGVYFIAKQNDLDANEQQRFFFIFLIGIWGDDHDRCQRLAISCCTLPACIFLYGLLFETQILFLFLVYQSSFRDTFYEILIILNTFFGLSAIDKAAKYCCALGQEENEGENTVYSVWETFLSLLNVMDAPILLITGVVYASQSLQNKEQLKTYDFVIYIIILISYESALLGFAVSLLCTLCLCAGTFLKLLTDCFSGG
ncbi:unnamed protein product [Rotaria sp. Silwood1]|nr:unnamed protein product [Rotaria sp. Silwood1]CAF4895692.1 unnamed protein product [Rotaria sp. Silwood1]